MAGESIMEASYRHPETIGSFANSPPNRWSRPGGPRPSHSGVLTHS
jgi:hypothetical protein